MLGGLEVLGRQPLAGEHVPAREAVAAHGGDLALVEQRLHHPLAVAPSPPRLFLAGRLPVDVHVADGDRPPLGDLGQGRRHELGVLLDALPDPAPGVQAGHAPAQQRPALDRVERRLVAPVLEHLAALPQPAGQRLAVVGAEPGEEHQLVAAGDHVHRVDLHGGEAVEHPAEVAAVHPARRTGVGEALGGQRDPPGVAQAHVERCGHAAAKLPVLRLPGQACSGGRGAQRGLSRGGRLRPV